MLAYPAALVALVLGSVVAASSGSTAAHSADLDPSEAELQEYLRANTGQVDFLIAGTYRSFATGLQAAELLARRAQLEYRPSTTLSAAGQPTFSREVCEENAWQWPCYVARGRADDGAYVSVEPTTAYDGVKPGYFIVVAASGDRGVVRGTRSQLSRRHVTSFIKTLPVWFGCMH